jgi:hypothetical protein
MFDFYLFRCLKLKNMYSKYVHNEFNLQNYKKKVRT